MNQATERPPGAKVCSISVGNRAAVLARRDALVEDHLQLVRAIAQRVAEHLPPSFDLEDLVGVGHMALIQAATSYRPEAHNGTPFSAYARPRIHGAMIDSIRRSKWAENTRPSIEDEDAAAPFSTPAPDHVEAIDVGRRRIQLKRAIGRLTPRHKRIIELHYEGGETLAAIAREMNCSPSLASHLHLEALAELREELENVA
jgi:RNA polymerase sigma factor (sigma-70 family)